MDYHSIIEQWRQSVRIDQKNGADRALSDQALDGFERLTARTTFTSEELQPILSAAKSKHLAPMYVGMDLLTALIKHQVVRDEWLKMAHSDQSHERWAAVTMLFDSRIPKSFAYQVVKKALTDRSIRVRIFAAERALSRTLTKLLPNMKAQLLRGTNPKVADELQWCVDLLEYSVNFDHCRSCWWRAADA